MNHLTALPYYGGKSLGQMSGRGVSALLPRASEGRMTYVETHGGMIGVLLSRKRASCEIVNDLNDRVYNFWKVVRDRYEDLERVIRFTPYHRTEFNECKASIDEGDELERARKFYAVVRMSMYHADGNSGGFGVVYDAKPGCRSLLEDRLAALHDRVARVQFECRPAVEQLDRVKDLSHAVIYVDPPYASVKSNDTYAVVQHDKSEMLDLLAVQRGRVAVSGYGSEWDDLDWNRHEFGVFTTTMKSDGNKRLERTEVVWTNYMPEVQAGLTL